MERDTTRQALGSQVSVAITSTALAIARPTRRRLVVENTDSTNPVYVQAGTATSSHFRIAAGKSMEFRTAVALEAIAVGGTVVCSLWDEFD